jgi:hypothetical protein
MKKLEVKSLQDNYVLIEVQQTPTRQLKGGLIDPNTKGTHALCKVIKTGVLKVFPTLMPGDLVIVSEYVIGEANKLPDIYTFQEKGKAYRIIQEYAIDMVVNEVEIPDESEEEISDGGIIFPNIHDINDPMFKAQLGENGSSLPN